MSYKDKSGFLSNIRHDLPSSIVVFLVAVPLCLGIALASGAPLFSGIIAGIVGGIVITSISRSSLGVSGPAAGLAVIVLSAIQDLGSFEIFLLAVVIAGLIQIILGILKAGVIGYYFPSSVIKGMLAGIGIFIIIKQIPLAFGYTKPEAGIVLSQGDKNIFSEFMNLLNYVNPGVILITSVCMIILILWEQPFMKRIRIFKIIQGPLVAVFAGIVLNLLLQHIPGLSLTPAQLVNLPVSDSINSFIDQFTLPDFTALFNPQVYIVALTIAVVASLESLLSVEATDKLDPQKRITPTNRELIAQGVGNMVSGLIGGLPTTQVIVRSSTNIMSGGKTRTSAFLHGVLILISVMTIPMVLNLIPLASLSAVLFMVGYKLAKPALFKELYSQGKHQFLPFMVTILGIIFSDLLTGIGLGLVVAVIYILWNNYKRPYHFNSNEYVKDNPVKIQLAEEVTFLNKAGIMRTLNQIPNGNQVIIDASKTKVIHPDVIEIIEDFQENAKTRDIKVDLINIPVKDMPDPVKEFGKILVEKKTTKKKLKSENILINP